MRIIADTIYRLCTIVAGFFLITILLLIVAQVVSRLTPVVLPGLDEFAAYCLTATTFFALAPTLRSGVHVRVSLLTERLSPGPRRLAEVWAYCLGLVLSLYLTYACVDFVITSFAMKEVAHGMVAVPLWIPRLSMPIGATVLCIAFLDGLIGALRSNKPSSAK